MNRVFTVLFIFTYRFETLTCCWWIRSAN